MEARDPRGRTKSWVEISQSALLENVALFRGLVSKGTRVAAVVKGNAYGHGLVEVAQAIKMSVGWFGVDSVDEGLVLRQLPVGKPILVLGYVPEDRLRDAVEARLRLMVYDPETVVRIAEIAKAMKIDAFIHLKLETGLNREGVGEDGLPLVLDALQNHRQVLLEGLTTPFTDAEGVEDETFAEEQVRRFQNMERLLGRYGLKASIRHISSTATTLWNRACDFELVRVGLGLYGLWPSAEARERVVSDKLRTRLAPVLSWRTRIAQVKTVKAHERIGFSGSWSLPEGGRIAILPVGYYDGYDRRLSGNAEVLVLGKRCRVIGNIGMNFAVVDVTRVVGARPSTMATLIGTERGETVSADEVAKAANASAREILTRIHPAIPRMVL